MDAATLYMVLTLPNGEQRKSTQEFQTLRACEVQADLLQQLGPIHPQPSGAITVYRCEGHMSPPNFYLLICGWRGRSCEHFGPLSRQACTAHEWVARLQHWSRTKLARCIERHQIIDFAKPKGEVDFLDMLGQPGLKK